MLFFDLNSESARCHTSGSPQEAMVYEFRKDRLCAINALHLHVRVQQMCRPLQRQPQGKNLFVLEPVSFHVLRPAYLSGESPGYRGMSSGGRAEIVPRRHTGKDITEYPGKRHVASFSSLLFLLYFIKGKEVLQIAKAEHYPCCEDLCCPLPIPEVVPVCLS